MIPLRAGVNKNPSSSQQIPDLVFKAVISARLTAQKQGNQVVLNLTPSPVIGDLRVGATYNFIYYWWTSRYNKTSNSPQKFTGNAGNVQMVSNKELPVFPGNLLGVISTSAPEGELIVSGETTFTVPCTENTWCIFQLVNQADPTDLHQSELELIG